MDFIKLRFFNVLMLFAIGISIGFLWGKRNKDYSHSSNEYKPLYTDTSLEKESDAGPYPGGEYKQLYISGVEKNLEKKSVMATDGKKKSESNPMDDDEEYQLSVVAESADSDTNEYEQNAIEQASIGAKNKEDTESFFSSPSSFYGKNVYVKVQMLIARKTKNGWQLNFAYSDADRNISYLYVDDPDMVSTENPDFKIGYYYKVSFRCTKGKLKDGNYLISIEPTGEKAPWASGISAIEQ